MTSQINTSLYRYVAYPQTASPPDGLYQVVNNRWWIVHPEKGLTIYNRTGLQCNENKRIVERLKPPDHDVVFIECAWIPVDLRDLQ